MAAAREHPAANWRDDIVESFYCLLGKYPRLRIFKHSNSQSVNRSFTPGACRHIEVVSHCWQYAHLLRFQLHSLIAQPLHDVRITMTVYYSDTDLTTRALLASYERRRVTGVEWQFRPLPPARLFRRAIGRNHAARATVADWIWFTDCDVVFGEGCFDQLAASLGLSSAPLVYPTMEYRSPPLPDSHPMLCKKMALAVPTEFPAHDFQAFQLHRATGPYQIVRGDIARAVGYCATPDVFQKPANHWRKATEDRVFRWLLGTEGVAVDGGPVYRIQHQEKGRYRKGGWLRNCLIRLRAALQARHIRKLTAHQKP